MMPTDSAPALKHQSGVALLEALIAILLVAFGILGMVGMQATSVAAVSDARYRIEAVQFADELIGQIWANTSNANVLPAYANDAGALPVLWRDRLYATLPGAEDNPPLIATGANNLVTLTIRWQPRNGDVHQHVVVTAVNRN